MSRTKKGKKGPSYDYWSKRPGNNSKDNRPRPGVKQHTHRLERLEGKKEVEKQQKDLEHEQT